MILKKMVRVNNKMKRILPLTLAAILGLTGCDGPNVTNVQAKGKETEDTSGIPGSDVMNLAYLLDNEKAYRGKSVTVKGVPLTKDIIGYNGVHLGLMLGTQDPLEDKRTLIAYISGTGTEHDVSQGYIQAAIAVQTEIDDGDRDTIYVTGKLEGINEKRRFKISSIEASGHRVDF
jgi:hypothetical protein